MEQALQACFSQYPAGKRLLLAVSGGKDSMAMLCAVLAYQSKAGGQVPFSVAVAQFDHQLRGAESAEDQAFLAEFLKNIPSWGLSSGLLGENLKEVPVFFGGTGTVAEEAKRKKQGIEETARQLRYAFLEDCMRQWQGDYLLTAHHALDNLETLILHLCRGSGTAGLGGIAPSRGTLLRPFLSVTPQEIQAYQEKYQIPYREDSSNQEEVYRRNFVRRNILDKFPQVNARFLEHSVNTIRIMREENAYLDKLVAEGLPCQKKPGEVSCSRRAWLDLDPVLQARALGYLLRQMSPGQALSQGQRHEIGNLLQGEAPCGEVCLSKPLRLRRSYDTIAIVSSHTLPPLAEVREILPQESIRWGQWEVRCQEVSQEEEGALVLEAQPLFLRKRAPGDRLTLPHRPRKTVKKLCIEEKIPREQRESLPVLVNQQEEVLAVVGLGRDLRACPREGKPLWKILFKEIEMR